MDYETRTRSWLKPDKKSGCMVLRETANWHSHRAAATQGNNRKLHAHPSTWPMATHHLISADPADIQIVPTCKAPWHKHNWLVWNPGTYLIHMKRIGCFTSKKHRWDPNIDQRPIRSDQNKEIKVTIFTYLKKAGLETVFSSKRHVKQVTYTTEYIILTSEIRTCLIIITRPQKTISKDLRGRGYQLHSPCLPSHCLTRPLRMVWDTWRCFGYTTVLPYVVTRGTPCIPHHSSTNLKRGL